MPELTFANFQSSFMAMDLLGDIDTLIGRAREKVEEGETQAKNVPNTDDLTEKQVKE